MAAHNWRGADAGYSAIHMWIKRNWAKEGACETCGGSGKTEWANLSGRYDRNDRSDWAELCTSCHRRLDAHGPTGDRVHGNARLTPRDVITIRRSRESARDLGRRFGVTTQAILRIRRRQTWKHM